MTTTQTMLAKIVEQMDATGVWVVSGRRVVKLHVARGSSKTGSKVRRNARWVDGRVRCPGWGDVLWHRLVVFHFMNPEGITRLAFKRFEVDHTNRDPQIVDYRRVAIVSPQCGR